MALLLGIFALFLGLSLYTSALGPLLRSVFQVVLEPEGIRVAGRLYPKDRLAWAEGPFPGGGTEAQWQRLMQVGRLSTGPLFHLVVGGERVPLWLDLPGWDRMLTHMGVDWKEQPGLVRYLHSVRGLAWLNGLLYPPAEVGEEWERARRRYQRLFAWLWIGVGMAGAAFSLEGQLPESASLVLLGVGVALGGYAFLALFGGKSPRDGWAEAYNPFRQKEAGGIRE
ncbi:hypothetical protein [Thermus tenuipuniceus]|uniref:hypothetical protein n=1 Tax=Thermus tenuipuniceus TaxID=2078690 RepID=UPI000FF894B8|nr:hypothetical protein [Thermus tenuipuniceus]